MPSRVPATTMSRVLSSKSSYVGLTTKSPFTYPILVAPIGPSNGMSDIVKAADAPFITRMSSGFSWSADRAVAIICTSLRNPLGNSGRRGRSARRFVRMASVLGRPSRLKKLPGILPRAYMRSSKSIVSGKKSMPSRGLAMVAVTRVIESPLRITTDPFACKASLPVSRLMSACPMRRSKIEEVIEKSIS